MKRKYMMLFMMISGPKQSGYNIDVNLKSPKGRQDILVAAIGLPEHLGRLHAIRSGIDISIF